MKLLKMITSSIYQIAALIFFIAFLLGVLNIHFSDRTNYCEMTFMYEYPQFVKISMAEYKEFPQYGLYAYSEGRFTERARKMWFDGVPVLYLPGNSGSHQQARSLASVALRKALSRGYEFHFDYFTISFNEELSGLYGGVLLKQTKFAAACVSKILSLYKTNKYTKHVPTSVILIGHSMGGLIAKRLLAYPSTMNSTNIAIALAAPLAAPVINFDYEFNDYYSFMEREWRTINGDPKIKETKTLFSFGSGSRDLLMPAGLTAANDSDINALTTSIPGVWVSSDHVSIVWCKQLVMTINRYLFSIVNPVTEQIIPDKKVHLAVAREYFVANRTMYLNPNEIQPTAPMLADAFWYEDNRRIYQISRPEIDKMTYLMIRLASFPHNRFVAIDAVNLDDRDWIFGCNAQYTYNMYRYCKQGTSLTEMSRWTGAAKNFGKRKLATVHLHSLIERHPDWSHVVIKVSPTREPVTLNVDVNDLHSRQITVPMPSDFAFGRTVILQETESNALYYELILPGLNAIWQAYLLYIEPTAGCKATEYHVSAELQVPWAQNHEYFHYFTHLKKSPMKLRLFKTNPNVTRAQDTTEAVKVVLLLDPQCKYTISLASSWYHILGQSARTFTPILIPYMAGGALLIAKSCLLSMCNVGSCVSLHGALRSDALKPYTPLLFVRVFITLLMVIPFGEFLFENASYQNQEVMYFVRSIMVLPAYLVALGCLNVLAAAALFMMVSSSQIAHRMLLKILWKGGPGLAERIAVGLQKIPMVVSAAMITAAPLSCGAASLAAGAAFYAFMISKMYEEYMEDYFYKIAAKIASRFCFFFKSKNKKKDKEEDKTPPNSAVAKPPADRKVQCLRHPNKNANNPEPNVQSGDKKEDKPDETGQCLRHRKDPKTVNVSESDDKGNENKDETKENKDNVVATVPDKQAEVTPVPKKPLHKTDLELAFELLGSDINFHMMMFLLWMVVTLVNVPALLTWARSFKYGMVLKPDTSRGPGLLLSICSTMLWQMDGPRRHLKGYKAMSIFITVVAVFIFTLGPLSTTYISWGVSLVFVVIVLQQICDIDDLPDIIPRPLRDDPNDHNEHNDHNGHNDHDDEGSESGEYTNEDDDDSQYSGSETEGPKEECECNENRIYTIFKNLRDKFNFSDE